MHQGIKNQGNSAANLFLIYTFLQFDNRKREKKMNTKRFFSKLVFFFTFFVIRVAMHFICCRLPALRHEIVFEASISYVFFFLKLNGFFP